MNPKDYSEFAISLDSNYDNIEGRMCGSSNDTSNRSLFQLMHGALGMAGETGEVVDLIKKHLIFNKTLDHEKLKLECGDVIYYMNILLSTIGSSFEEIMQMNYDKLKARYPNGFSEQSALERKDESPIVNGHFLMNEDIETEFAKIANKYIPEFT